MIGAIVYQLTKNLTEKEIKEAGFEDYFVDHTLGIYPQSASGVPFSAGTFAVKGDPITDLHENMAADDSTLKIHTKIPHTLNLSTRDFWLYVTVLYLFDGKHQYDFCLRSD